MKQTTEPFEELFIPRKEMGSSDTTVYRVYSDYNNFELVEATSALDALSQCKIKKIYKVERHDPLGYNVIHFNNVMQMAAKTDVKDNLAPSKQDAVVSQAIEQSPPPAATEAAPLSNDDVDKLLNS